MLRLLRPTLSEITATSAIYRHFRRMEMSIAGGRPTEFMGRKIGTPFVVSWNKIRKEEVGQVTLPVQATKPTFGVPGLPCLPNKIRRLSYGVRFVSVIRGEVCALKGREMFLISPYTRTLASRAVRRKSGMLSRLFRTLRPGRLLAYPGITRAVH